MNKLLSSLILAFLLIATPFIVIATLIYCPHILIALVFIAIWYVVYTESGGE